MTEQPAILDNLKWAHPPGGGLPIWAAVLIVLGLAAGTAAFFWFRRKRKQALEAAQAAQPAHEKALEALSKLAPWLDQDNDMDFSMEVSRILRVYIQDRFEIRAPHRSTEEFLGEAGDSEKLPFAHQELLGDFLHQCDLVKFARRTAARRRKEELLATAEQFVRDTILQPQEAATP